MFNYKETNFTKEESMFSKLATVSRYLLGLMFTIFGLNGVMMAFGSGFIPMPPPSPTMVTIMTGFMATE
jgi:hypothetical protein